MTESPLGAAVHRKTIQSFNRSIALLADRRRCWLLLLSHLSLGLLLCTVCMCVCVYLLLGVGWSGWQ